MGAIASVLEMISSATLVLSAFKGSAQVAKVTDIVQESVGVINALTPLVTQWAGGEEITPEDVRAALATETKALADFDAMIASKS